MTTGPKQPFIDLRESGPKAAPPQPRRFQVLALNGGGYRGLYTARFLERIEEHYGCRTHSQFKLLTGTSIGALLASALALEIPARTIVEKMQKHGPLIFRRWPVLTWSKRTFVSAPYSAAPLRAAIVDTLGEANARISLAAVEKPLAVNAIDFTHGRPEIFRTKGLAGADASDVPLVEAVIASAAAPTYFPAHAIGDRTLIDGGLVANAPELVGVTEACGTMHAPLDQVYVLAIGTAARRQGAALERIGRPSIVSWMVKRDLFNATLAAQEALATAQCRTLLRERYHRVDREPLENQVKAIRALDLASAKATATLRSLADESWQDERTSRVFGNFFEALPVR